jgi:hypothetical protein
MQVSYRREATVEQLKEWWPPAVKAKGCVPTSEEDVGDRGYSATFDMPNGDSALLSIRPTGTL